MTLSSLQAPRVILSGFSLSNCIDKEKAGLPGLPIKGLVKIAK